MLGDQFINTLTDEDHPDYDNRRIDKDFLNEKIKYYSPHFYLCGPPSFIEDITKALKELDVKPRSIVLEK
jgi:ferredoxin-NADP reductase